jgi:hypothetical protein
VTFQHRSTGSSLGSAGVSSHDRRCR